MFIQMILDVASGFLAPQDVEDLSTKIPTTEQWTQAVVHHRRDNLDRVNPATRKAYKCVENRHDLIDRVQRQIMASLLPLLRKQDGFMYCWPRGHRGTEWLRYKPGMFFRPHTDFERYVCGGLRPYVALLGLNDVEEGGETRVGDRKCVGGARKNGMVFFQATELHEALPVIRGEKICLKMEFFVVTADPDDLFCVGRGNGTSVWSRSAIQRFDNYLRSFISFISFQTSSKQKMVVSEKTAQDLRRLMFAIAEARGEDKIDNSNLCDPYFPTLSTRFLHDVFTCLEYLRSPPHHRTSTVLLGNDDQAWEYLNTHTNFLPDSARLMVGLWFKKSGKDTYRLHSVYHRLGHNVNSCSTSDLPTDRYRPYATIHRHALAEFIHDQDLAVGAAPAYDSNDLEESGKDLPRTHQPFDWTTVLQTVQPSDRVQKKIRRHGTVITTETEMCNDEDAGTTTETYETYVSFDIQIRWFLYVQST